MEAIEVLYVGSYGLVGRRITEVTSTSYVIRLRKQKKPTREKLFQLKHIRIHQSEAKSEATA